MYPSSSPLVERQGKHSDLPGKDSCKIEMNYKGKKSKNKDSKKNKMSRKRKHSLYKPNNLPEPTRSRKKPQSSKTITPLPTRRAAQATTRPTLFGKEWPNRRDGGFRGFLGGHVRGSGWPFLLLQYQHNRNHKLNACA